MGLAPQTKKIGDLTATLTANRISSRVPKVLLMVKRVAVSCWEITPSNSMDDSPWDS